MSDLDVLYVVRPGEKNEELRYSLRSIAAHLPHRRVVIAGHAPRWVRGVTVIERPQLSSKWENSAANLAAALGDPDLSPEFVMMDDDFFVMRPMDRVPVLHRGRVADLRTEADSAAPRRAAGRIATCRILELLGVTDPLNYELHMPMPVVGEWMRRALALAAGPGMPATRCLHIRTLYGNLLQLGGELVADVKFRGEVEWDPAAPFLSSNDLLWFTHPAGRVIRETFQERSPYEAVE